MALLQSHPIPVVIGRGADAFIIPSRVSASSRSFPANSIFRAGNQASAGQSEEGRIRTASIRTQ